jgi:hypothetical protein
MIHRDGAGRPLFAHGERESLSPRSPTGCANVPKPFEEVISFLSLSPVRALWRNWCGKEGEKKGKKKI